MGVSLDEEMSNMIKFKYAYNAATKTISVINEMLDTLINRTGITGR
jgi:flagellar hook-associated protein 1 FlgK